MGPDAVPTEVLVQAADAVRDLEQGKLVPIRRHDPRERNLPFVLMVYAVMALVMVGIRFGVMHAGFWLLLVFSLAAVGGALWASKQMIEVSADRNGIVLSRADQIVRLPWDDVKSVENNYRS